MRCLIEINPAKGEIEEGHRRKAGEKGGVGSDYGSS